MWKQGSFLLLALMLLLAGCSSEASLVRDAIVTSLDKPNYEIHGTMKLVGDLEKLPEVLGESTDPEFAALADALKAGITITGAQSDLRNANLVLKVNDDKLLRESGMWSGEQIAQAEMVLHDDMVYIKTPLDQKFVAMDSRYQTSDAHSANNLDPVKLNELNDKMNTLAQDFIKKYIAKYGYKLNHAKNLGRETVKLPNGQSVQATHVSIELDLKELVSMFLFAAKDATTNAEVKKFAVELMVLTQALEEEHEGKAKKSTEAEKRAMAEASVTIGMNALKEWLDTEGKKYTADEIVRMAKEEGLNELKWTLDYYIDDAKIPVHQTGTLLLTFQQPESKQPLTFGLETDFYMFNVGNATSISVPKADQTVTMEMLAADRQTLSHFHEKSFLRKWIEWELEQQKGRLPATP